MQVKVAVLAAAATMALHSPLVLDLCYHERQIVPCNSAMLVLVHYQVIRHTDVVSINDTTASCSSVYSHMCALTWSGVSPEAVPMCQHA